MRLFFLLPLLIGCTSIRPTVTEYPSYPKNVEVVGIETYKESRLWTNYETECIKYGATGFYVTRAPFSADAVTYFKSVK